MNMSGTVWQTYLWRSNFQYIKSYMIYCRNGAGMFPEIDPNRLAGEDIDAIVCLISPAVIQDIFGYKIEHPKLANKIKDWVMNPDENPALAETTAVQNGEVYLIQNEMVWSPRHVVALTTKAKWFHPGLFMDLDRQAVHQQYLDILNIDYDFDESGIFYWWGVVRKEWSDYGSTEGEYTEINSAVSVELRGIWNDWKKEWKYDVYLCGGGAVRKVWCSGEKLPHIKSEYNKEELAYTCVASYPPKNSVWNIINPGTRPSDAGFSYEWGVVMNQNQTIMFDVNLNLISIENARKTDETNHYWRVIITSPPDPQKLSVEQMKEYGISGYEATHYISYDDNAYSEMTCSYFHNSGMILVKQDFINTIAGE